MLFDPPKTDARATAVPSPELACRLLRVEHTLGEAFGRIAQGTDYPYATAALWSTHDLLSYLLAQIGPAHLVAATWSMEEHAVVRLLQLAEAGRLLSIHMLVDWRVQVRTPAAHVLAKQHFADIRVGACHAKVSVLRNEEWAVSIVGSANYTNNPRIEAGHLSTSRPVADFHAAWIDAEIARRKPFGIDSRELKSDGRA